VIDKVFSLPGVVFLFFFPFFLRCLLDEERLADHPLLFSFFPSFLSASAGGERE